jgi:hypothetical protein
MRVATPGKVEALAREQKCLIKVSGGSRDLGRQLPEGIRTVRWWHCRIQLLHPPAEELECDTIPAGQFVEDRQSVAALQPKIVKPEAIGHREGPFGGRNSLRDGTRVVLGALPVRLAAAVQARALSLDQQQPGSFGVVRRRFLALDDEGLDARRIRVDPEGARIERNR